MTAVLAVVIGMILFSATEWLALPRSWTTAVPAYYGAVEDNKKLLGITSSGSEPGAVRRRKDAPLCPECHMAHNGECL